MAKLADRDRLQHMLDFARTGRRLSRHRKRSDLDEDEGFELAMARVLEVIGEAASGVSKTCREQNPEIPWTQIIAMRNRLIHGYDTIDADITWEVLTQDLPPLIDSLERVLAIPTPPRRKKKNK